MKRTLERFGAVHKAYKNGGVRAVFDWALALNELDKAVAYLEALDREAVVESVQQRGRKRHN